jgi:hypothetical protein
MHVVDQPRVRRRVALPFRINTSGADAFNCEVHHRAYFIDHIFGEARIVRTDVIRMNHIRSDDVAKFES